MKRVLPFIALLVVMAASCSDPQDPNPTYKNRGLITGQDTRRCSCCGGWLIEIEGVQYRFLKLPPNSSLQLTEATFPIPVLVSWSKMENLERCTEDRLITVHSIVRE